MDPLPSDNQFDGCKSDFSDDATKETNLEEARLTIGGDDNDDKEMPDEPDEASEGNEIKENTNGAELRGDSGDDNDKKALSNEADAGGEDDSSDEEKAEEKERLKYSFLAISQRRTEQVSKDVLHPLVHRVFGTPVLLRVVRLESLSGRELYDLVAKRLRNFVPQTTSTFLVDTSESTDRQIPSTKGGEPQPAEEGTQPDAVRQRLQKTTTDMEKVSGGPVPRYGFRLRITSRDGRRCALLPWYECSIGCLVPDDDDPTVVMCGDSLVIDWHFAVDLATSGFGTRSNQSDQGSQQASSFRSRASGVTVKNHSSCGYGAKQKGYAGAITLEDCLDAFAKEERIPEVSLVGGMWDLPTLMTS
jgi:hypothetical protein